MNKNYSVSTVKTLVTYLEMRSDPGFNIQPLPNTQILPAKLISPVFYRKLYSGAGRDVGWTDRLLLSDEELLNILRHQAVEIVILYVGNEVAGFAELDARDFPDIELKYFGLFPSFRGKGYGSYFLRVMITRAWRQKPRRLWLHTNDRDHPRALELYQKVGFVVYDQQIEDQTIILDSHNPPDNASL